MYTKDALRYSISEPSNHCLHIGILPACKLPPLQCTQEVGHYTQPQQNVVQRKPSKPEMQASLSSSFGGLALNHSVQSLGRMANYGLIKLSSLSAWHERKKRTDRHMACSQLIGNMTSEGSPRGVGDGIE